MKKIFLLLVLCLGLFTSCGFEERIKAQNEQTEIENLEIPQSKQTNNEIILHHKGYSVGYNTENLLPNWVAWELYKEKLTEDASRYKKFLPDPDLPKEYAITTHEYTHSGWNRGHMCPAADNKWDADAMKESFYTTNICPQNENLNKGDWNDLEEACREWAMTESVYIVCGPVLYKEPVYGFIGKEFEIRVPEAFYKVVLKGIESGNPQAIGFIFKNQSGNNKLYKYVNTIDEVERITGIDFFPALDDEIETQVEAKYDLEQWELNR